MSTPAGPWNWRRRYFGRIPGPSRAAPRDIPAEPAQKSPRRIIVEEGWPLPVVVVAHHVTFDGHPDSYPLQMASKILSDGQSARFYRKLVYESGIASSAAAVGQLSEHPNLFYAVRRRAARAHAGRGGAGARAGTRPAAHRARVGAGTGLARSGSSPAISCWAGRPFSRKPVSSPARLVLHKGDVGFVDAEFDRFQRVSAADIQRVAQACFAPNTRMVITVTPRPAKEGAE